MMTQQLTGDQNDNTGTLVITCPAGGLPELMGLMEELKLRPNVKTNGPMIKTLTVDNPPMS
jgi:hypothetical protein